MNTRTIGKLEFHTLLNEEIDPGDDACQYEVTDSGVRAKEFTREDYHRLHRDERKVLRQFEREARLDFPCTPDELRAWIGRQGEGFKLDEDVLAQIECKNISDAEDQETEQSNIEDCVWTLAAFKKTFPIGKNDRAWDTAMVRDNSLKKARRENPDGKRAICLNVGEVCRWLIHKGHYDGDEIRKALACGQVDRERNGKWDDLLKKTVMHS